MIQLNREKKMLLLKWLKQGYLEDLELSMLKQTEKVTRSELERQLERLTKLNGAIECARLRRLGECYLQCDEWGKARADEEVREYYKRIEDEDKAEANKS